MFTLSAGMQLPMERRSVFAFFAAPENLGRITPASLHFRIDSPLPLAMREGALIDYTILLHRIPMHWRTRITRWRPPEEFADEQVKGPYAEWVHRHRFRDITGGTEVLDDVTYRLPLGRLGALAWPIVRRELDKIFRYRQSAIRAALLGEVGPPPEHPDWVTHARSLIR